LDSCHYFKSDIIEDDSIKDNVVYIKVSKIEDVLNDIEGKVNEVKDKLELINGLTEIDEAKELISLLSRKLY
jgi:hypothetical protein